MATMVCAHEEVFGRTGPVRYQQTAQSRPARRAIQNQPAHSGWLGKALSDKRVFLKVSSPLGAFASLRSTHASEEFKAAPKMTTPNIKKHARKIKNEPEKLFLCFNGSFRTEQSLKYASL